MDDWPSYAAQRPATIEVHAQFENTPSWFGGKGNSEYHSLWNALCEKNGAVPLFSKQGANEGFRKHGRCLFFAAAETGAEAIFATMDGKVLCRLSRSDVGGHRLSKVGVEEMKRLCQRPETPKRDFDAL